MDVLTTINRRRTVQTQQADKRQVQNNAGGYTFTITPEQQLRRFLTLGSDGATYYTSAKDLTKENAQVVIDMAETEHATLRRVILDVSLRGAAPKQNPTIFALAVACSIGSDTDRSAALALIPDVCRTGTHLFLFARYVEQFRGWGRGLRNAVASWYTQRDASTVAYQAVKYRQREGWSHRDLLRLSHPHAATQEMRSLFDWICRGTISDTAPRIVEGWAKSQEVGANVPALVREYGLTWEMLPDAALGDVKVWDALLDVGMGQTALMRQLPRLTRLGMLPAMGGRTSEIAARLADAERLRQGRVHPVNVLVAQRTYAAGQSARGESSWTPNQKIVDALDAAFYAAFGAVQPAGKRTMLAIDVSGSMTAPISNMPITCREASAALALVQLATEPDAAAFGFTSSNPWGWGRNNTEFTPLNLSPRQRLDDAIRSISNLPFGGTDCALPMMIAQRAKAEVDTFVVYTDNETWAGSVHPHQALESYRQSMGIPARLVVVGMTATPFSIANPSDAGMLDIAGFDSAVPTLISDFSRGDV